MRHMTSIANKVLPLLFLYHQAYVPSKPYLTPLISSDFLMFPSPEGERNTTPHDTPGKNA